MLIGLCFVGYFGKWLECLRLCGGVLEIRMYIFVVFECYDKLRILYRVLVIVFGVLLFFWVEYVVSYDFIVERLGVKLCFCVIKVLFCGGWLWYLISLNWMLFVFDEEIFCEMIFMFCFVDVM